jgi:hypothetical protein
MTGMELDGAPNAEPVVISAAAAPVPAIFKNSRLPERELCDMSFSPFANVPDNANSIRAWPTRAFDI